MTYDLPNPFLFLPHSAVGNAAPVENPTPSPSAGAAPAYQPCPDCWLREPCDKHCPAAYGVIGEYKPFQLDEQAFALEIEPVPAFISRPIVDELEALLELARAEEWPAPPRRMVG